MPDSRYASWIATVRNHPNTRSRSGWRRSRINHAVWQASSINARDAFTEPPTDRTSARW